MCRINRAPYELHRSLSFLKHILIRKLQVIWRSRGRDYGYVTVSYLFGNNFHLPATNLVSVSVKAAFVTNTATITAMTPLLLVHHVAGTRAFVCVFTQTTSMSSATERWYQT